jgi:hypothetical protein
MQEAEIEELLNESEGTALDFKRDQYPLTNDIEKSEFIKDVLAFTNSWRRTDAFILVGVEELKGGGRSNPVGITKHLKDSDLQQLVNSKTSRPITFSYEAVKFQTVEIGVIKISVQERPVFLTKDFGKLKKDVVYVRRGSSTTEASLDETLKMRVGFTVPTLDLQLADVEERTLLGKNVQLMSEVVKYDESTIPVRERGIFQSILTNENYERDFARYIATTALLNALGFSVKNAGSALASNVRLELNVATHQDIMLIDEYAYPTRPSPNSRFDIPHVFGLNRNLAVDSHGKDLTIKVNFGSIQPGATAWSDEFYVGALKPFDIDLSGYLYGDNLPQPQAVSFIITIDTTRRDLDRDELDD